jgi:hypothetical protein
VKRIVLNLCGIKSRGGISIAKNFLEKNSHLDIFILYDNESLNKFLENYKKKLISIPRYLHPFLNVFLSQDTRESINRSDLIIHFGNFAFKSKIKTLTFIQNILPLVSPFSSFRNIFLRLLYIFSFYISDEIIVQQEHVAKRINSKKTRIIGTLISKKVKQNNEGGFVLIVDDNKNKNPEFLIKLTNKLIELKHEVTVINTSNFTISNSAKVIENPNHDDLLNILKKNKTYIHASEYETVGLPIYEALNSGLKVVVPKKDYLSIKNPNIFRYKSGNLESAVQACLNSNNKKSHFEEIPVYVENWGLT